MRHLYTPIIPDTVYAVAHPVGEPTAEARRYSTLVARWSHVSFTRPVPLIDRRDVEPGDVVYSSHYGAREVRAVHTTEVANTTIGHGGPPALLPTVQFDFLIGGTLRTERYDGTIPVLVRGSDGHQFGSNT